MTLLCRQIMPLAFDVYIGTYHWHYSRSDSSWITQPILKTVVDFVSCCISQLPPTRGTGVVRMPRMLANVSDKIYECDLWHLLCVLTTTQQNNNSEKVNKNIAWIKTQFRIETSLENNIQQKMRTLLQLIKEQQRCSICVWCKWGCVVCSCVSNECMCMLLCMNVCVVHSPMWCECFAS